MAESLFDPDEGRVRKREAMGRAYVNADREWKADVMEIIWKVARTHSEFNTDEVWELLGQYYPDAKTHERRAMGPMMILAQQRGWIVKTGEFRNTSMVQAHSRPKEVWRSLIVRTPR